MNKALLIILWLIILMILSVNAQSQQLQLREINDHITFVKEPWSGLCFAYIGKYGPGPHHAATALTNIPCEAIKKDMGPVPTISVYQYE